MKAWKENNVDREALASFEEDLLLHIPTDEKNLKRSNFYHLGMRTAEFRKESLPEANQVEHREFINPYTTLKISETDSIGNTPSSPVKELGLVEKTANWIKENPGKAILGALLIGGGSYLLIKYFKGRNLGFTDNETSVKRRSRRKTETAHLAEIPKEETSEAPITAKEIAIGVAALAGGALAGTVLGDYAVTASVPAGVIGMVSNNIPLIAAAMGLVFSGTLRKIFQSFFGNDTKEIEMNKKGYVKTMLGYIRPSVSTS